MNYELIWILAGFALILSILTLIWLERPLFRVGTYKPQEEQDPAFGTPKVSVIVYSQVSEEELMDYLTTISEQDYPDFEVIVVCEATAESNEVLSECCTRRFNNVYVTFIPPGSHNLSRRKLALTLGMKAAKGEIVVTTTANAEIHSQSWLSKLISPFRRENAESIEVSLGYSHFDYSQMKGFGKWYREFVALLTDAEWIGYALARKPYRGDGYNLAFRRKLFFDHKGYSQSMYLHSGDDDIFIHEIATPENTAMVLDRESILSIGLGEASKRIWRALKEQYDFTSHWLPREPFRRAGAVSTMQWLILFLYIATGILGYVQIGNMYDITSYIPAFVSCVLLLLFQLAQILIYRRAAEKMDATRLWWALPIFWLLKPLLNKLFDFRHRHTRRWNYTWKR